MMKMGFEAYLTKPVRRAILHDTLVAVVEGRRRPDSRRRLTLVPPAPGRDPSDAGS
jgi:hypothetical protein